MLDLRAAEKMLLTAMPARAHINPTADPDRPSDLIFQVGTQKMRARIVKHANLTTAKQALALAPRPQILLMERTTPGIRDFLTNQGVGWIDQTGSAQVTTESLLISRDSIAVNEKKRARHWTKSMFSAAEALLTGSIGTVAAITERTGLAPSSAASALGALTKMGLLAADSLRGRNAGRRIVKPTELLSAYSEAAASSSSKFSVQVGVQWQDPIKELNKIGEIWDREGITWAARSAVAANLMAPFGTQISPLELYVDAFTPSAMVAALQSAGLKPLVGGRLTVAPFPTEGMSHLVKVLSNIPVVPWPRAYAELQNSGVRGEDIAEHLKEVMERETR